MQSERCHCISQTKSHFAWSQHTNSNACHHLLLCMSTPLYVYSYLDGEGWDGFSWLVVCIWSVHAGRAEQCPPLSSPPPPPPHHPPPPPTLAPRLLSALRFFWACGRVLSGRESTASAVLCGTIILKHDDGGRWIHLAPLQCGDKSWLSDRRDEHSWRRRCENIPFATSATNPDLTHGFKSWNTDVTEEWSWDHEL